MHGKLDPQLHRAAIRSIFSFGGKWMMNIPSYGDESWYDVMQVCLNGHRITDSLKSHPNDAKAYCLDCGAATVSGCSRCHVPIQGYQHGPGIVWPGPHAPIDACKI